ncbi:MAG: putative rane protein [Ramlibacter sp.]|nr:putative rane protein [Ramlibacter sp.]
MSVHAICISRAIWVGAEDIATEIAKELGFRYVDEEIVNLAAKQRNLSPTVVADAERRKSLLGQLIADISRGGVGELINYIPSQEALPTGNDDLRVLIRDAIRDTASQGNVVIVAHAASYALRGRTDILRVLITGTPLARAKRWLLTSGGKSPAEAAETIRASDEARAHYLKRFYGVDAERPEDYDITISTDNLSAAQATELIIRAARAVGANSLAAASVKTGWDRAPASAGGPPA